MLKYENNVKLITLATVFPATCVVMYFKWLFFSSGQPLTKEHV